MSRSPSLPEPASAGPSPDEVDPRVDPAGSLRAVPDPAPAPAPVDPQGGEEAIGATPDDAQTSPGTGVFRDEIVVDAVKGWRHDLAGLGGPNTLLWYRDLTEGTLDLTTVHPGGVSMLMAGGSTRLSHLVRERSAFVEARRRARVIREKSIELRQEHGLVSCFMALGMASWDVPGSRVPQAPVLLRRCEIHPVDAAGTDFDLDLGTEVEVNPVLLNYLRYEQGIEIDPAALAALAAVSTRFDPMRVFRELSRRCASVPGFTVADRRVVSTFSYTKLQMVSDLTKQGLALGDHEVLAALAAVPGAARLDGPLDDSPLDPAREVLALDADATQSRAVRDVRQGRSIALVGGPGTGKTRTVANIVAGLAADGRSVLYVSAHRAGVDALVAELDQAGLSGLVEDVHGRLPDARDVARDVVTALDRRRPAREADGRGVREQLRRTGDDLQATLDAVHAPRAPWGLSVFEMREALAAQRELPHPPTSEVLLPAEVITALDLDEVKVVRSQLASIASEGGWSEDWPDDPWYRAWVVSAEEAQKAKDLVDGLAAGRFAAARAALDATLVEAGLPAAETADHWDGALDLMLGVRKTLDVLPEDVFLQPLDYLLGATADRQYRQERGLFIGWRTRRDLRKRAESLLNPDVSLDQLHDVLSAAHEQRTAWTAWSGTEDLPRVPASLDESRRIWDSLEADLRWLSDRLGTTAEGGDLFGISVDDLERRLTRLAARSDRLAVLPRVSAALDRCLAAGFADVVADIAGRHVPADAVGPEVDRIWWRSLLAHVAEQDPRIGRHDGDHLRGLVEEFVRLDHDHVQASRDEVRFAVARRLHDAAASYPREQEIVRYAASGTGEGVPARELLAQTGALALDVLPCWAMSPQVVATMLPLGAWFDVVVVDGADQMPVAHAVSAISRGRQAVLVGDDRRPVVMPYTTAVAEPGEQPDPDDAVPTQSGDTLLDAALEHLPVRRLRLVHADADESLLGFTNHVAYDGELVTTPGTSDAARIRLVVAGQGGDAGVEPGRVRVPGSEGDLVLSTPVIGDPEVAAVLALVRRHIAEGKGESFLVVTLSSRRAEEIRQALVTAAELDTDLREWLAAGGADVERVAHIDRVLEARRDSVVLVLGYRRQADGSLPRRYGRLDADGGERALAAALAIARRRVTVVTEISPEDFGDRRPASTGAALVRDLLRHAELQGHAAELGENTGTTDPTAAPVAPVAEGTVLLRGLSEALVREGLTTSFRHGSGPRRVDLAVGEEGASRPVVAVQLDDLDHASVTDLRDRERIRTELLRRHGWEVVRVWSADLLADPASAVPLVREGLRAVDARAVLRERRGRG